ncbi:MAG TPA: SGNH/GDSL hydrolase family protein [Puia sp.]|nr:SGNH/GDSL hydrolase family protein [Puia sp.]
MKPAFILAIGLQFLCGLLFAQERVFSRTMEVQPLSLLEYSLLIKCSNDSLKAVACLRFFDSAGHELLVYKSAPVSAVSFTKSGNYTEAPPYTRYALVTVEKDSTQNGEIDIKDFHADLNIGVSSTRHEPLCDQDQYMRPFWNSDTIYNETVLLYSLHGAAATGRMLFVPDKILSVKSFDLQNNYSKANDFAVNGRTITRKVDSKMPFRTDSSFDKQDLAWFNLQSQWIVVTYTHQDKWKGPAPSYKGEMMPKTLAKLRSKSALRIVAYGMSITRGLDVSGYDTVAPFMPPYVELFAGALKKDYGYQDIQLYNTALPGARADWGARYAGQYINPLKPDLVIIDFGMNDFWNYKPEEFKGFIQTIIDKVRAANPDAEFLMLSNMKFDPDYVSESDKNKTFYVNNMEGYHTVLQQLEATGIINLDMTTLSGMIYSRKKAKDCLANPLHPNDYMARWYAQGMAALFQQ